VLVTGGAGYIGSHAALRLLRDSFRVTIVVRSHSSPLIWRHYQLVNAYYSLSVFSRIIYREETLGQSRFSRTCFQSLAGCNSYKLI
jgi:thioester reductase-like protein